MKQRGVDQPSRALLGPHLSTKTMGGRLVDWKKLMPRMHVCVWIAFLAFLFNNLAPSYTAMIPQVHSNANVQCENDINCYPGTFCNPETHSCVNCTNCSKFMLMPASNDCAKNQKECGSCQLGFVLDKGNHCAPVTEGVSSDNPKKSEESGSSERLGIWVFLGVVCCGPVLFLTCLTVKYYKKKHSTSQSSQDMELGVPSNSANGPSSCGSAEGNGETKALAIPEDDRHPPPYNCNDYFEFDSSTTNAHVVTERLQNAVPYMLGNFASSPPEDQTLEQQNDDAVVPDLDGQAELEPSEHTPMLLDQQASNTQLDLSSFVSNGNPDIEINERPANSAELVAVQVGQENLSETRESPLSIGNNSSSSVTTGRRTAHSRRQTSAEPQGRPSSSRISNSLQSNGEQALDLSVASTSNAIDVQMPPAMNDSGNESGSEEYLLAFGLNVNFVALVGSRIRNNSHPHSEVPARPTLEHALSYSTIEDTVMDLSSVTDFHNGSTDSGMEANEPNVSRNVPDEVEDYPEQMDES